MRRGKICGGCRPTTCNVDDCYEPRVAGAAQCDAHVNRCRRCAGPMRSGTLCGTCRPTTCNATDCYQARTGNFKQCAQHVKRCERCPTPLPAKTKLCAVCHREKCNLCTRKRDTGSAHCAECRPCPTEGCRRAVATNRHACAACVRRCVQCGQAKQPEGKACKVCLRLRNYGREDEQFSRDLRARLEQGTLTCDCCAAAIADFNKVRIDHDHHTRAADKVRGVICNTCNTTLVDGMQVPAKLVQFMRYLRQSNPETVGLMHLLSAPDANLDDAVAHAQRLAQLTYDDAVHELRELMQPAGPSDPDRSG